MVVFSFWKFFSSRFWESSYILYTKFGWKYRIFSLQAISNWRSIEGRPNEIRWAWLPLSKMPGDSGEEMAARRYKGVSKNRGTPKWIVYNGTPYFLMDDFSETSTRYHCLLCCGQFVFLMHDFLFSFGFKSSKSHVFPGLDFKTGLHTGMSRIKWFENWEPQKNCLETMLFW